MVIACIIFQGFFAMVEMACVSFNKVRLQYYVSKGSRRAIWLSKLLHQPGLLFGTSLICINGALQLGSECARRFYESMGLSPDIAPLTQVVIVLIFAEIAPLFAGRRYAEHAAMLGIPALYFCSILFRPLIWFLDGLCRWVHRFIGTSQGAGLYLSREELQKILEEQDHEEFNTVVTHIFSLKNRTAKEVMRPLRSVQGVPSICTVAEMRSLLTTHYSAFVPIYHKSPENIVAIAYPRDMLRQAENKKIRDYARPPWFITETDSIMAILRQFRRNNQSVAIVLNDKGLATGILTLDEIVDGIFGQADSWMSIEDTLLQTPHHVVVDRTFPGDTKIADFNARYRVHLDGQGAETLSELVVQLLGHPPAVGESVKVDQFELTVEEASLLGAKTISIRTL
jgi:putative hemolysin